MGAERLFVYGTLLDSDRMQAWIGGITAWHVTATATVGGRLYDAGDYPVLRPSRTLSERVPGRLLELEDGGAALARLDEYEGVDEGLFRRRRRTVLCDDGRRLQAWVYEYRRSVRGLRRIECWGEGLKD